MGHCGSSHSLPLNRPLYPPSCGILVYKALTLSVTRVATSGIVSWSSRTVWRKWLVSLIRRGG